MPIWAHLYFNANLSVDDGLRGGEDEGRGDGLLVSLEAEVDLHGLRVRSSAINQQLPEIDITIGVYINNPQWAKVTLLMSPERVDRLFPSFLGL